MHPPSSHDLSTLPTSRQSQLLKGSTFLFPHPFSLQRKSRSLSSSSSNSFTSETSNNSISLNEILAQSISRSSSQNSNARSSCFSRVDVEEEKAEFGEQFLGLLEPRPGLGWWGVDEVLEEEERFSRRGSSS